MTFNYENDVKDLYNVELTEKDRYILRITLITFYIFVLLNIINIIMLITMDFFWY